MYFSFFCNRKSPNWAGFPFDLCKPSTRQEDIDLSAICFVSTIWEVAFLYCRKKLIVSMLLVLTLAYLIQANTLQVWYVGWTNEISTVAQSIIASQFSAKTGINVQIEPVNWGDYYNKYLLSLASRDTPDLFVLGTETVDFGLRGGLVDLAKFKPEEFAKMEKEIFGSLMGPFSFRDTRFGMPVSIDAMVAAYRQDILNDMGLDIPKEWNDIKKWQPKALSQNRTFGFYYGSAQYASEWGAYTLVTQNGGQFFNRDGFSSALDKPESIKGFIEYISLFKDYKFPLAGVGIAPFVSGDWLMITDGIWLYPNLLQHAPQLKGKWKLDLLPGTKKDDGSIHHGSYASGIVMGISTYSKQKEEAWQFLKWFSTTDTQANIANAIFEQIPGTMWLPANKESFGKLKIEDYARQTFYDQLTHSEPAPYAINVAVLYRYIQFAVDKCILKDVDAKEAILEAAKDMNNEMARRKKEYSRFLADL